MIKRIYQKLLQKVLNRDYGHSDNPGYENFAERKRLMQFNRFFSQYKVFSIIYCIAFAAALIIMLVILNHLQAMSLQGLFTTGKIEYGQVSIWQTLKDFYPAVIILCLLGIVFFFKFAYDVRISYGEINVGQKGTDRFVDHDTELPKQYISVPEKDLPFDGPGGFPVARKDDRIYIDTTATHNMIIGMTRSGKGEILVLPMIDINSRASEKCSMVITDPKLELSGRTIPKLQERGYKCYVLNLIDPELSMGYNPLTTIISEYKDGNEDIAQQLCSSLGYNIFAPQEGEKDPYFTDQARNVFIAAVMADIEDNIKKDQEENLRYKHEHDKREKERETLYYKELYAEDYVVFRIRQAVDAVLETEPRLTDSAAALIEELRYQNHEEQVQKAIQVLDQAKLEAVRTFQYKPTQFKRRPFYPGHENEDKINIYSIIKMCNALASVKTGGGKTALDLYFDNRPENDFAKITYGAIITASANTKGTIMSVFRSKVAVFGFESIAKMTAKSSLDFMDLGFGKEPVAVFLGLPDYDESNHFIATVFIDQMYYTLAKLATAMPGGKLPRRVSFILDEFGNLPALDNMKSIASVGLGRNLVFTFIVQAFSQLSELYGEYNTKTIIGNCGNKMYIMTSDDDTAEEISKSLGNETIITTNRTGKKLSLHKEITEMVEEKPLLEPTELMNLEPGETVLLRYMLREELGNMKKIKARPIANLGEHRMKYAYEYLTGTFPQGQILYESPNLRKIIERDPELSKMKLTVAKVELETTRHIDIKARSRSAEAYLEHLEWRMEAFPASLTLPLDQKVRMNRVFTLLNLTQEEKELYLIAGEEDPETGEILYPEDILLNGPIVDYAWQLVPYRSKAISEKGYELLDIMLPLPIRKKPPEEIQAEEQLEAEMLKQISHLVDERGENYEARTS